MSSGEAEQTAAPHLKALLLAALDLLMIHDTYLLRVDASERSVSHRLAVYLQDLLTITWAVDCEYNRHGDDTKVLRPPDEPIYWTDGEAKTVFPDVVVHRRGKEGPNLLVIEMKKRDGTKADFDRDKLCAYTSPPYSYTLGAFLEFSTGEHGKIAVIEWYVAGRLEQREER